MEDDAKLSRRSILKSAVLMAIIAASAATHKQAAAQQKASKATMKYQDRPNGEMKCSNCLQFDPPSSCKVVEGTISPNGYCIAWVKKA